MGFQELESLIYTEQQASCGSFIDSESLSSYILKLRAKAEVVAHYDKGQCVGLVAFYCNDSEKESAFITLVLLDKAFRGKGIANMLIESVLRLCTIRQFSQCSLEVRSDNDAAIRLYERNGFVVKDKYDEKLLMSVSLN